VSSVDPGLRSGRSYDSVEVGEELPVLEYALPLYRLIVAAGATRDLSRIHHNDEFARASGAPSMYASALFLQGMWERLLREFIGPAGLITAMRDMRLVKFTPVGSIARIEGRVVAKNNRDGRAMVDIEVRTVVDGAVTVGPGVCTVVLSS
jgi:acyl dehydratase